MRNLSNTCKLVLVKLTLLFSVLTGHANLFLELESRYEGDGWFQYKMKMPVDPYWAYDMIGYFGANFPGATGESVVAAPWTYNGSGGVVFDETQRQVRPVEYVFRFRSSHRHFKVQERGGLITMSLIPHSWTGLHSGGRVYSMNMVGFAALTCLVPCSESEADGSAAVHTAKLSLIPDVRIEDILMSDRQVTGLKISLPVSSTFNVEGSTNLVDWHYVDQFSGDLGTSTISSSSLANGGPFYRVLITSFNGHTLSSAQPAPATGMKGSPVDAAKIKVTAQGPVVSFPSQTDARYHVEFLTPQGHLVKAAEIPGSARETSLPLATAGPSSLPLVVKVYQIAADK